MPVKTLSALRRKLLRWYQKNKRDLPWRKTEDPYAIWVSETMLQQTQVKTVLSYYERFLKAFPTLRDLAGAPRRRVLNLWSGLGYYRRAENLRRAARQLMRHHHCRFPQNYDDFRALPGVGDYTAGAVFSMAFQQRYPAVDGNVRRVLGRFFDLSDQAELRARAARLVSPSRPGDFNQALMELGATVCAPREPHCAICPLKHECAARRLGSLMRTGSSPRQTAFYDVIWPVAIVRRGRRILLRRRPAQGLLAGLWELPVVEIVKHQRVEHALRRELSKSGEDFPALRRIGELRHSITYRRIRAPLFLIDDPAPAKKPPPVRNWRWTARSELDDFPMSSLSKKALRVLSLHEKNLS